MVSCTNLFKLQAHKLKKKYKKLQWFTHRKNGYGHIFFHLRTIVNRG
jgi:hypothetical protein